MVVQAILEWLHVFCGIMWFGSVLYADLVLLPALQGLPGEHRDAVTGPIGQQTLKVLLPFSIATVVLGVFRGLAAGVLQQFGHAYGWTWLASLVVGVGLIYWAFGVAAPGLRRLQAIVGDPEAYERQMARLKVIAGLELLGFLVIFTLMVAMRFGA